MAKRFELGDRVSFVSKYGNTVTGVYRGEQTMPTARGDAIFAIVLSDNAFGAISPPAVNCAVRPGHLSSAA